MRLSSSATPSPAPTRAASPPSLGWMLLLAIALFSLALPVIGPLDDHHFVERSHNHDHIYLNGWPVQHDHVYQTGSAHRHAVPQDVTPETGGQQPVAGTLFLAPATTGLTLAALNAPYHPAPESLRPPPPSGSSGNLLQRFSPELTRARGVSVPPPLPPPIV